ncbi:MAG TPA: molybdopterin-dependent oxidoreductase [Acidimicrobiia bacterium]
MAPSTVLGTCHHDCPDSCGWVATVENGTAVKLRGNPEHPYSRGELCPKVNRFLDRVYSPDRLRHPLIRSGQKGSAAFRQATWGEALALVASRVHAAVDRHGGETVLPWWDAGTQGLLQLSSLDQRLFARLGSSRLVGSLCGGTAAAGVEATYGTPKAADALNARHADLVLLWGTNTRLTNRHLWPYIEEARQRGAEVVVIDPIRTITADSADRFIQPVPGTDVALMLAMMHVLIRDDLIDHDYVARHSVGFERLAAHVAGWTPARAEEICGVPAAEIERLATSYGSTRGAFIRTLIGPEHHENGAMFFRTIACLPVLTGAWRHRGGGLARSVGSWIDVNVDESTFAAPHLEPDGTRREINMNHLGRALTDATLDPPVTVLFVWNGNPLVTVPGAHLTRRGLQRDDLFTVVSEQFMTDTARFADVIFPATTQLEHTDVVPAWGHLYLGWNEQAIEPIGESVPNTELWRRLAGALGFAEPELFESDQALIEAALRGVDLDELRSTGFVRLDVDQDLNPYRDGGFSTPSGRAELFSERLAERGLPGLPTFRAPAEGPGGRAETAGRFPLTLLTPKHHSRFLNSSYTHLPGHGPREGGPFVELDPADAADRGITEGDSARVWNDRASVTVPVRLSGRLRPGVAAVPFGWWQSDFGGETTVNALTSDTPTDWGGGVAYSDTRVEVEKVD